MSRIFSPSSSIMMSSFLKIPCRVQLEKSNRKLAYLCDRDKRKKTSESSILEFGETIQHFRIFKRKRNLLCHPEQEQKKNWVLMVLNCCFWGKKRCFSKRKKKKNSRKRLYSLEKEIYTVAPEQKHKSLFFTWCDCLNLCFQRLELETDVTNNLKKFLFLKV